MNKKGDHYAFEEIIFVVLNIIYFFMLIFFVIRASSGAYISEQFYAKQIGLLVDGAKPGTLLSVDVTKPYNTAEKNNMDKGNIFRIINSKLIVQMSGSRAYQYQIFNDVDVKIAPAYRIVNEGNGNEVFLDIYIGEKNV
jgi:hypothetical protein